MPDLLRFGEIDERWFIKHGCGRAPAMRAAREFREWLGNKRGRTERAAMRELISKTVGKHISAISHYWSPDNWRKLSDTTLLALDSITRELGYEPPARSAPRLRIRGARRIALLADLGNVPSPRYHLAVIRSVVEAVVASQFSVSIHEITRDDAHTRTSLRRIISHSRPHALIWFRLTPDVGSLEVLAGKALPTIVVHGALNRYRRPVLGHVVPEQRPIKNLVKQWARKLEGAPRTGQVVIATMPQEPGGSLSIRNQRVELIETGLAEVGFTPVRYVVLDYSASNALAVISAYPTAVGYVCLSDEIAVGIKHLLLAGGQRGASQAVLGFDASLLAHMHGIASISQHIEVIGQLVRDLLCDFFRQNPYETSSWPEFRELHVPVTLQLPKQNNRPSSAQARSGRKLHSESACRKK